MLIYICLTTRIWRSQRNQEFEASLLSSHLSDCKDPGSRKPWSMDVAHGRVLASCVYTENQRM